MQTEVVFDGLAHVDLKKIKNKWFRSAATAANQNQQRLQNHLAASGADVTTVNVFQLNNFGTTKRAVLETIPETCFDCMEGYILIFYPVLPKHLRRRDTAVGLSANAGDVDAADDDEASGTDVDRDITISISTGASPTL